MSDETDDEKQQRIKLELQKDTRQIADIWKDAVRSYKGVTGVALKPEFNSTDDMLKFGVDQMNNFHKYRHDSKKVDKLRTLFTGTLSYIDLAGQQLVASAPSFPPAPAIGTALTVLAKACRQVSADYDVVTAFFEDMNAFLQRIAILESRLPNDAAYRNCLMDVFSSFLNMCAFATKSIELGRFKKWMISVVKLGADNTELGAARKKMDDAISYLQSATELAILGNTEMLRLMNIDLQQNQDMQTKLIQSQTTMLQTVIDTQQAVRDDLTSIQKLLAIYEERSRDDPKQRAMLAPGEGKPSTSNRVRSFFEEMPDPQREYDIIKESFVVDASSWPSMESAWTEWLFRDSEQVDDLPSRILVISGLPGTGKSHLAVAARDHLTTIAEQNPDSNVCVAQFYFRETIPGCDVLLNAIQWIAIHVAEQNPALCERINTEIGRDDLYSSDELVEQDWWDTLTKPLFNNSPENHLYVVWDGLDELNEEEQVKALEFFKSIQEAAGLNVRFLCTSRPEFAAKLVDLGADTITVTQGKQALDLKALIWNHLNNDNALRKLSRYMKQRIATTLEDTSMNLLYAEHLLRQFDTTGREPLILKVLNSNLPGTLQGLYEAMLTDLQAYLKSDQQFGVRILMCWMAFSHRQLTLDEHIALLKLFSGESFDLEQDLQDRYLSRFVRIADSDDRDISKPLQSNLLNLQLLEISDTAYNDGNLPLKFQGRSLRDFFRNATNDEISLRTPVMEAQRRIFVFCSRTLCGTLKDVHPGLRQYAADKWLWHLRFLHKGNPESMTEEDQITTIEALSALFNTQPTAAAGISTLTGGKPKEYFHQDDLSICADFAKLAYSLGGRISATAQKWAESAMACSHNAYLPLARGHVMNWFRAKVWKSVLLHYQFARMTLKLCNHASPLKKEIMDRIVADDDWPFSEEEIMGIFEAFNDIPKDAGAHRALATLLSKSGPNWIGFNETALIHADRAIALSNDDIMLLDTTVLSIQTNISLKAWDKAKEGIRNILNNGIDKPPPIMRPVLIARGRAEAGLGEFDLASQSYAEARNTKTSYPMAGNLVYEEFDIAKKGNDPSRVIDILKTWNALDRLTLMTQYYGPENIFHITFQTLAGQCRQEDFMVEVYHESIALLDKLDASAPMKYQLSLAHWRVRNDIETAKLVLNEILDGISNGQQYALTDEDPANQLVYAINLMTTMIYEQFRRTSDPSIKMALYMEMKGLTQRNLAQSIPILRAGLLHHSFTLSRMARKMVGAQEFYKYLQSTFDECYEALTDKVSWNDSDVLLTLASVLSRLDGLDEEARIAVSCMLSELGVEGEEDEEASGGDEKEIAQPPKVISAEPGKADKEDDSIDHEDEETSDRPDEETRKSDDDKDDDDDEDDEDSDDQADDTPDANNTTIKTPSDDNSSSSSSSTVSDDADPEEMEYFCDGECDPNYQWSSWTNHPPNPIYVCLTCHKTILCAACHAKITSYNAGAKNTSGRSYCGENHEYIIGPIEGWRGVKGGMMRIKGREDVRFREWLEGLKGKWAEAWERFWLAED